MTNICRYCGLDFEPSPNTPYQMFCCVPCRKAYYRVANGLGTTRKKKQTTEEKIANIAVKARAMGISYGEYVARYEYGKKA